MNALRHSSQAIRQQSRAACERARAVLRRLDAPHKHANLLTAKHDPNP